MRISEFQHVSRNFYEQAIIKHVQQSRVPWPKDGRCEFLASLANTVSLVQNPKLPRRKTQSH
jgi:hypothetical protein